MQRIKSAALVAVAVSTLLAAACAPVQIATPRAAVAPQAVAVTRPVNLTPVVRDATIVAGPADAATSFTARITLGDSIMVDGAGVTVDGNTVTITGGGNYHLTGSLADGQIVVAAKDSEAVELILDGVGITSSVTAPIQVQSAKRATIVLADGSQNVLADAASRPAVAADADEPNAALYSAVDLAISGNGSLVVDARYNDGIASKDDLDIADGTIAVTSVGDGIRGRDSLDITGGNIAVNAGKDGLKSSNDEDSEKGVINISGGTIEITAQGDGIQAETILGIRGGSIAIAAGGGSSETPSDDLSTKGLKGTAGVTIDGGTITVDASDDAIHSNGSLVVRGGTLVLASADDAMHADATLDVAGGDITILKAYEGLESARITIADGSIRLKSTDDGLNAADGSGESMMPGRPGPGQASASSNNLLTVSGGYIVIDSDTDGIDANGSINMTGGTVIVNGPTGQGNGALDYDGAFTISGGTLIAAGSSGMAQAPGNSSTQPSVLINLPSSMPAGTLVHIGAQDGAELLTFAPSKAFQSLVVSSPALEMGTTYVVSTGGSSTGTVTDAVYSDGTYSDGTQVLSFTVADVVTSAGAPTGGPGRGGPRR